MISSFWSVSANLPGFKISWTDEDVAVWEERLSKAGSKLVPSALRQSSLPSRLAEALLQELSEDSQQKLSERRAADLSKGERAALLQKLTGYPLNCTGHEGYPKVRPSSWSGPGKVKKFPSRMDQRFWSLYHMQKIYS